MTKVKIYDFDKTLAQGDSIMSLIEYAKVHNIASRSAIYWRLFLASLNFLLGFKIERFKSFAAWLVNKFSDEDLEKYVTWHLKTYGYQNLIDDIHEEGYTTILCSASLERYVKIIARDLGFDYCIATHHDEKKVLGTNNAKEEKLIRLQALFARENIEVDYENSKAYTDSVKNDQWMCSPCKSKYVVNDRRSHDGFINIEGYRR